jgi:hypothetical protein
VKYLLLSLVSLVSLVFASCAKDLEDAAIYQEPTPDLPPAPREAPKASVAVDKPANRLAKPNKPADGLRLPQDMLTLPQDDQLRSPSTGSKDGKATVIVRPPEE